MSIRYDVQIIYGFACDNPVARDRKTGTPTYLADWLLEHRPDLEQWNAGKSNGGDPCFFVGVLMAEVKDVGRTTQPWSVITPAHLIPSADVQAEVAAAFSDLLALDASLLNHDAAIGVYLIGDVA